MKRSHWSFDHNIGKLYVSTCFVRSSSFCSKIRLSGVEHKLYRCQREDSDMLTPHSTQKSRKVGPTLSPSIEEPRWRAQTSKGTAVEVLRLPKGHRWRCSDFHRDSGGGAQTSTGTAVEVLRPPKGQRWRCSDFQRDSGGGAQTSTETAVEVLRLPQGQRWKCSDLHRDTFKPWTGHRNLGPDTGGGAQTSKPSITHQWGCSDFQALDWAPVGMLD
ncbi:hypothetical protein PoB_000006700 [Plakobranchus ocellatus]|uniref:Uncharacterized protein n=1 Tax=Plakobranchus ocellatus TaxID=259542 RepID=A0AAV3XRV3_9GAST|nr:hypothetical protein PoB_000006700 [Plakobranchus ocellatus]